MYQLVIPYNEFTKNYKSMRSAKTAAKRILKEFYPYNYQEISFDKSFIDSTWITIYDYNGEYLGSIIPPNE